MNNTNRKTHLLATTAVLAFTITAARPPLIGAAERPVSDFLSKQGTYVVFDDTDFHFLGCENGYYAELLCPDHPRWLLAWFDPAGGTGVIVDYAGADALWLKQTHGIDLGTICTGSASERPLQDGRAEVSVVVHARNALTWAVNPAVDFMTDPLVFGCRWTDLIGTSDRSFLALADCAFKITFINTAPGAPLPDLAELFTCRSPGDLLSLSLTAQAQGPLRAAFGVADGTPGFLQTRQTGLPAIAAKANPNSRVALDACPAEKVVLKAVGE